MKRYVYILLTAFLLLLLQTAGFKVFSHAGVWFPQMLLLWVIVLSLKSSAVEVVWLSFLTGFFAELISTMYFGSWIVAFFTLGSASYFLTRKLTAQEVSVPLVLVLVASATLLLPLIVFGYNALLALLGLTVGAGFGEFYSAGIFLTIISNLILFYPLQWLYRLIPEKQEGLR